MKWDLVDETYWCWFSSETCFLRLLLSTDILNRYIQPVFDDCILHNSQCRFWCYSRESIWKSIRFRFSLLVNARTLWLQLVSKTWMVLLLNNVTKESAWWHYHLMILALRVSPSSLGRKKREKSFSLIRHNRLRKDVQYTVLEDTNEFWWKKMQHICEYNDINKISLYRYPIKKYWTLLWWVLWYIYRVLIY